MRIFPRVTFAALAAVLLLSGCVPTSPTVTPEPLPSSTPIFATEDDALAAATAAYAAYVKTTDQILIDGGANPERIQAFASRDALRAALDGYSKFREEGYRNVGSSKFDNVTLEQYSPNAEGGQDLVGIYVCLDVSGVDVVDQSGRSVVSADRPAQQAFEVSFDFTRTSNGLVIASREPWRGEQICAQ